MVILQLHLSVLCICACQSVYLYYSFNIFTCFISGIIGLVIKTGFFSQVSTFAKRQISYLSQLSTSVNCFFAILF